jgi:monosaccharide-transporting ATPase
MSGPLPSRQADRDAAIVPRVSVEAISKRYGGVRALVDVSLAVRPGTVHALLGENGAGKSTLVKILSGAVRPDIGRLVVDGVEVELPTPAQARRSGIAVVHQELSLFPSMPVVSNVYAGRELHDRIGLLDEPRMRDELAVTMDAVGWSFPMRRPVGRLTLAEQQMVEIVRAFHFRAGLILLDEPNSALTERETEALYASIRRFRERGQSFLLVSHRLDEVLTVADDVTVLRDGAVVHSGPAAGLALRDVVRMMVGESGAEAVTRPSRDRTAAPVRLSVADLAAGAAHGVSFELRQGEVLGLAGLEGSGVTDVFDAIFGESKPTAGTMSLDGATYRPRSSADAVRRSVASIPADRRTGGLLMERSIADNIVLVVLDRFRGRAGLVSDSALARFARGFMDRLRIRARSVDTPVAQLSGGNQQKVVLAKWLAVAPDLLLLNDPTRGIDVGAKAEVHDIIRDLAEADISVLVWSSEAEELLTICDRILVLRNGVIRATLDPTTVTRRELLLAVVGDAAGSDEARDAAEAGNAEPSRG